MTLIAVVDFETDGGEPPAPLELGVVWLQLQRGGNVQQVGQATSLLQWRGALAPSAQGVHHIGQGRLRRARHPLAAARRHWRPAALVAAYHHAGYDAPVLAALLGRAGLAVPPLQVCTLRCAKHLWPAAPDYKLATLRYWLRLHPSPPAWAQPHRALYDAAVTAALMRRLLATRSLAQLVALSDPALPALLPKVPFGKHRGEGWQQVPADYLGWMMRTARADPEAFDIDTRHSAYQEIMRRRRAVEQQRRDSEAAAAQARVDGRAGAGAAPDVGQPVGVHAGPDRGAAGGEHQGTAGQGAGAAAGAPPGQGRDQAGAPDQQGADGGGGGAAPQGDGGPAPPQGAGV